MKVIVGGKELGGVVISLSSGTHNNAAAGAGAGAGAGAAVNTGSVESRVVAEFRPIMDVDAMDVGWNASAQRALEDELRGYSITPTTFESREYASSLQNATYIDTYRFNDTSVCRFGINVFAEELRHTRPTEDAGGTHGSRSRYSNKSGTNLLDAVKGIKHEAVEIKVLQEAVNHLFSRLEICSVLVDIIARGGDGLSINERTGEYETHTVILYKNPPNAEGTHSVTVIDPSNFAFSAHLGNPDIIGDSTEGGSVPKVGHTLLAKNEDGLPKIVIIPNSKVKIYQPKKATGLMHKDYRDCVDIAVKLALGFDVAEKTSIASVDELKANVVIQSIANTAIDIHYPARIKHPVRIKQASDPKIVKLFHAFEEMHTVTKAAAAIKVDGGQVAVAKTYEEFLGRELPYDEHLEAGIEYLGPMVAGIQTQFEAYTTEVAPQQVSLGGEGEGGCCSSSSCIIL